MPRNTYERWPANVARWVTTATVLVSVSWAAAIRPPATLVVAALSTIAAVFVLWSAAQSRQPLRLSPLAIPLLVMSLAAALQLVPLPPGLRGALDPAGEEAARIVLRGLGARSPWQPLTRDVAATLHQCARLWSLAALAVVFGWLGGGRHRGAVRGALTLALVAVVAAGALVAAGVPVPNAIVPLADNRFARFPFVNPNHAATFFGCLLPLLITQASSKDEPARAAPWLFLVLCANLALFATLSRAGIVSALLGQAVTLALVARRRDTSQPRRLVALVAGAVLVGFAVAAVPLVEKTSRLADDLKTGRLQAAADALRMLRDYPWTGVGRGAFALVFAHYGRMAGSIRFAFVENEYLQLLVDFGVVAAAAIVLAGALALWRVRPWFRGSSPGAQAALIGLLVMALHNAFDFSWETGGVAVAGCALAALAFRGEGARLNLVAAGAWLAACFAFVALALSPLGRTADDDATRIRAAHDPAAAAALATDAFRRHPSDGFLADMAAGALIEARDPAAFAWLERALWLGPRDPIAHQLTARALYLAGKKEQAAAELSEAFLDGDESYIAETRSEALRLFAHDGDGELLQRALPTLRAVHVVAEPLAGHQRWALLDLVAQRGVALDGNDAESVAFIVQSRVARRDGEELEHWALKLAELDKTPEAVVLAARGLREAGAAGAARALLEKDRAGRFDSGVSVELARLLMADKQLVQARAVLEDALAQAPLPSQRAVINLALADIDETTGNLFRAQYERAEAARLSKRQ